MCGELVARAVADERILRALRIPEQFWNWIAASFKRGDASLYGRFDLRYDGKGSAKLLEYNADTPTAVFETAVFQWMWLEQAIERQIVPRNADQYNSLHEKLIAGWKVIGEGRKLHLACMTDNPEDRDTVSYIRECAHQAGLETAVLAMTDIGRTTKGVFVLELVRDWGPIGADRIYNLARLGYYDDAEANAQLVTPDGWMRTGDLCTIDPSGVLTVAGRASDVIIREASEADVEIFVYATDDIAQMPTDAGKFVAVRAGHQDQERKGLMARRHDCATGLSRSSTQAGSDPAVHGQ
jgi:hypothetical protein